MGLPQGRYFSSLPVYVYTERGSIQTESPAQSATPGVASTLILRDGEEGGCRRGERTCVARPEYAKGVLALEPRHALHIHVQGVPPIRSRLVIAPLTPLEYI